MEAGRPELGVGLTIGARHRAFTGVEQPRAVGRQCDTGYRGAGDREPGRPTPSRAGD